MLTEPAGRYSAPVGAGGNEFSSDTIMDEELKMLVLSRKTGQELVIGDNIRITVNRVSGNRGTLGITAPDEVRIMRGELEPVVKSFETEKPEVEATDSEETAPTSIAAPWVGHEEGLNAPRQLH